MVARETFVTGTRDGRDRPIGRDLANAKIKRVGDIEISAGVDREAGRRVQLSVDSRAAVARVSRLSIPGDRMDDAVWRDFADSMPEPFRDVQIPGSIRSEPCWKEELRVNRGRAVAREPGRGPGERSDRAVGRHTADAAVLAISDVEIAGAIQRKSGRAPQLSARGWATVAIETPCSAAGDSRNRAAGSQFEKLSFRRLTSGEVASEVKVSCGIAPHQILPVQLSVQIPVQLCNRADHAVRSDFADAIRPADE